MDKVKTWLDDKKNLPILIAGAVVFVIILTFVVVKAKNGANSETTASQSPAGFGPGAGMKGGMPGGPGGMRPGGTGPGAGGMQPGGMGAGAGGMRPGGMGAGAGGMRPGGMGGGMGAAQQTAAAPTAMASAPASTGAVLQPMLPYRKDPFVPFTGAPTRSTIIRSMLPQVSHYEFPKPVKPITLPSMVSIVRRETPEVLPPQPFRRMAGVLINGRVSAIMETNGESDIVVPGMEVTRGNSRVRVESITSDEIILKTLDTKRPITIRVNLSGSVAVPTAAATGVTAGNPNMRDRGMAPIVPVL